VSPHKIYFNRHALYENKNKKHRPNVSEYDGSIAVAKNAGKDEEIMK
jgi:hypothetical protein